MRMIRMIAAGLLVLTGAASAAETIDTDKVRVKAETLYADLEHPWGLDFLPDGIAVVTEREGRMKLLYPDGRTARIANVPEVAAKGQGGLLDVIAAPDFATTGVIFFSFSEPGKGGAGTAVARARLEADPPALSGIEVIFSMERKTSKSQHFGSRLVAHPDGTLFITTGDRGESDRAQDFGDHAGAVLRILQEGGIPRDNPYFDSEEALPEIWSKGHRNPQGAVLDPVTGALWTVEHGARGGDELNRPLPGRNYGWPVISYGRHYSGLPIGVGQKAPGYEQPLWYWDPSIAASGLAVYQGEMFPEWEGNFLVGALRGELVSRLEREGGYKITGEERMFEGRFGRIREISIAPDGAVWLLTDESNGAVIRISRDE